MYIITIDVYDPKVGSMSAHVVVATVSHDEPELSQVFIPSTLWAIEMKDLDQYLLCLMQCHRNGVLVDAVPVFLLSISSEAMHAIETVNTFDATHPIIIPLK